MDQLQAFTAKDIRTAARLVNTLLSKGGRIEDLFAAAAIATQRPVVWKLPVVVDREVPKEYFLPSIGWAPLRTWLRIKKILEKHAISQEEVREFVQSERRQWLEKSPSGRRKP